METIPPEMYPHYSPEALMKNMNIVKTRFDLPSSSTDLFISRIFTSLVAGCAVGILGIYNSFVLLKQGRNHRLVAWLGLLCPHHGFDLIPIGLQIKISIPTIFF